MGLTVYDVEIPTNLDSLEVFGTDVDDLTVFGTLVWQKQKYYFIVFASNGGTGSMPQQTMPVGVATALAANLFARTGYLFYGWSVSESGARLYTDGQKVTDITAAGETATLYALWDAITWYIRYNANGGSGNMANSAHEYDTAKALTANAFAKTGYAFIGWGTGPSSAKAYDNGQSVKNLKSNDGDILDLYALWDAITWYVKYHANGGSGSMSNSAHEYDTAKNLTENAFSRTGYTFAYWATSSTGSKAYSDGQSVKNLKSTQGDILNLYAIWSAITYYVRYNANGGSGSMGNQQFTYDVSAKLSSNTFSRTGYLFASWQGSVAGATMVFGNAQEVVNLAAESGEVVDLYALWNAITWYVKYNANGGSGSMSNSTHKYDTAKALTANAFTKSGSSFIGWATSSYGAVAYNNGQSVKNLKSEHGAVLNLYAVWKTPFYLNANLGLPYSYTVEENGEGSGYVPTGEGTFWYVYCTHGGTIAYSSVTQEISGIDRKNCSKVKFNGYLGTGGAATIEIGGVSHTITSGENIVDISSLTAQTISVRLSTGYGATDHEVQISAPYFY